MKWNNTIGLVLMVLSYQSFNAQVTINLTSIPKDTPPNAKIYAAGSFNGWKPDDANFEFQKKSDHQYSLTLPKTDAPSVEYKLTLGCWDDVEGDQNGRPISNRIIENPKDQKIEVSILSWQKPMEKKSTASKNVHILNEKFEIPQLNTERRIWIYLPEDYSTSKKKYPVVYMHDGQNLFDELTGYAGEWKIDETLDSLFQTTKKSFIVVGIDHGNEERLNDYGPWNNPKYGGGKGDLYADFLALTLKPYIDKNYRTLTSSEKTALMGSSMGGLISLYTGTKYPTQFGKLGVFSPSTWFTRTELFQYLDQISPLNQKTSFYFYGGHLEGDRLVEDMQDIAKILEQHKVKSNHIKINTEQKGTHQEKFWAKEFPKALQFLFP